MKVFVYFNLHKKCYSLKSLEKQTRGKVIAHAKALTLKDVEFTVSETGRQRVLKEKCKNVHAGLKGTVTDITAIEYFYIEDTKTSASLDFNGEFCEITYNPYRHTNFVFRKTGKSIHHAKIVKMFLNKEAPIVLAPCSEER